MPVRAPFFLLFWDMQHWIKTVSNHKSILGRIICFFDLKIFGIFLLCILYGCTQEQEGVNTTYTNHPAEDKMLLIMAAPSAEDPYYQDIFKEIIDFQIQYAKAISGNDNVIILVDEYTHQFYRGLVPEDILMHADVLDIWIRDFGSINPLHPVLYKYTSASMSESESQEVQNSLKVFLSQAGVTVEASEDFLDGGNIVDNFAGRVITTQRYNSDNSISDTIARSRLKEKLRCTEVAILEPDDTVLAHSDGMVCWADENTLLINDYSEYPDYRASLFNELQNAFPGLNLIEIPVYYTNESWQGFESSCGIYVNSVLTLKNLYVPVFELPSDSFIISRIRSVSSRNIIPVNASQVCKMGGSVRCLTWQLSGSAAEKLILAARKH